MLLTAQRVTSGEKQGVNAFLYWHGRDILADDPFLLLDADPGTLQLRMVELDPGGNRVRSYLDVVIPDQATRAQVEAALDVLERAPRPDAVPALIHVGGGAARISMDAGLAPIWQEEVAELVGVARACVLSFPDLRVTPRYSRSAGSLDEGERAICREAGGRGDTEAVLALMRQLLRARRASELAEAVEVYAESRGDPRVRTFLADHVPALFSAHYVPTFGSVAFEQFVNRGLDNPGWGRALRDAVANADGDAVDREARLLVVA